MLKSYLQHVLCTAVIALLSTTANAVILPLEGRLETAPGSGVYLAYYDPNLYITWSKNAVTSAAGDWYDQMNYTASLTIGGIGGWRLPSADVNADGAIINCFGGGVAGCEDNEMGYLHWEEGITNATPGPFINVQPSGYWTSTDFLSDTSEAWYFGKSNGAQGVIVKTFLGYDGWAVHNGDVAMIPTPPALWLFGSGLLGLIGVVRRKAA